MAAQRVYAGYGDYKLANTVDFVVHLEVPAVRSLYKSVLTGTVGYMDVAGYAIHLASSYSPSTENDILV